MKTSRVIADRLWLVMCFAAICLAVIPLASIIIDVISKGLPTITWTFLTALPGNALEPGGLANAIQGTVILVALGSSIGLPIGVLSGVYIAEYGGGAYGSVIRFLGDVLAGISSIVVGVVVYCLIVLTFHHFSALAGGLALGIMIIPISSNTTTAALRAVPGSVREASLALGIRKWRTSLLITANAKAGIATGVLLSVARITGETAPILLTALSSTQPFAGLNSPVASLTVYIYQYGTSPFKDLQTQAWGAALLLMLLVLGINVAVRSGLEEGEPVASPASNSGSDTASPNTSVNQVKVELSRLSASFGSKKILTDIDMKIPPNRVTAIIGPSGSGKSTLIRCINRMHELIPSATTTGKVLLDGEDVYASGVNAADIRRKVGMVFQKPNPFPNMTIRDNAVAGLKLDGVRDKKRLDEAARKSLESAFLWDEVKDDLNKSGVNLSGGQQQRLCIARAIAIDPEVILMDEPCSALDPIATGKIEELIVALRTRFTVVIVTHNLQQAARIADNVAFLYLGRLVEFGTTDQIFQKPKNELTERYVTGRFG